MIFEPLQEKHFPLLLSWLNKPHVQKFYSLRPWVLNEIKEKFLLGNLQRFIAFDGQVPFGYIQSYQVSEYPWEEMDLEEEIVSHAAGLDLFIGEEAFLGKGFGKKMIEAYLEKHIWPQWRTCLVDPDIRNEDSQALFLKCGFKKHKIVYSVTPLGERVTLQLFIKSNPKTL